MSIQDIEAARAANAAAITATNEAERKLVDEVDGKIELAMLLGSVLSSVLRQLQGLDSAAFSAKGYWRLRAELNPTLAHYGFVIKEHPTLRDVGVVVRIK